METTIFFRTDNGSYYIYDMRQSILLNGHPILERVYTYRKKEDELLTELLRNDFPEYSSEEINYYIKKYKYLSHAGLFQEFNTDDIISGIITPEIVENNIANLDNILFQLTGNCNLNCIYCCYGDMYVIENTKISMTTKIVDKLFDFMLPHWKSSKNISFNNPIQIGFYGGEPLLNITLIAYIISCCEKIETENIHFIYSVTTNGVLLDKYMDFLVEKDISLLISLDGNNEHNKLRINKKGEESFEQVYRNIKLLQNKYPLYFENKVNFNSVLNKYSTTKDVHHYILNEFGKIPMMETISTHQLEVEKAKLFEDIYQPYVESTELVKERMEKSSLYLELSFFFYYLLNNSYKHYTEMIYGMDKRLKKIPTGTCLPFYKKMFITSDGNLLACERIGTLNVLGTITDQVDLDYNQIADIYTRHFAHIKKQCENCYSIGSCGQCLFQLPMNENGLYHCPYMHDKERYQTHLGDLFGKLEEMPDLFESINKMVSA